VAFHPTTEQKTTNKHMRSSLSSGEKVHLPLFFCLSSNPRGGLLVAVKPHELENDDDEAWWFASPFIIKPQTVAEVFFCAEPEIRYFIKEPLSHSILEMFLWMLCRGGESHSIMVL
jgi:hypothetical protein